MNKKVYLVVFLLGLIYYSKGQTVQAIEEFSSMIEINESMYAPVVGKLLPAFQIKDLNGLIYNKDSLKNNKVTFINLWFSACKPCIAELQMLNCLYASVKDSANVRFLSITWERPEKAKETIKKYAIQYPVFFAAPSVTSELTFGRGYPTSIITDHKGKILFISSGGASKPAETIELCWKKEIDKVLKDIH